MKIIGIIGTAKNTGKTTTLSAIIDDCTEKKIFTALTSIGYDGEDLDNLTYLPKPKLLLRKGSLIATSEICLSNTKAKFEILFKTDIITPLGNIYILKITGEGEMVLAGPNNIHDLKTIIDILKGYNPELIMIDGALNRMAPMFLADKIIISTGASRNTNIDLLKKEISMISDIFKFPVFKSTGEEIKTIQLYREKITDTGIFSLMDDPDLDKLILFAPEKAQKIFLPNIFSEKIVSKLFNFIDGKSQNDLEVVFFEPFRVLLSLDFMGFEKSFLKRNSGFFFIRRPELIAITINPFYPKLENYHFKPDYIDKTLLCSQIKKDNPIPVFNVFDDGVGKITEKIY
jgi:hypothetical protein